MISEPGEGVRQRAPWTQPLMWLWAKKAWIAGGVGALLILTTVYVLWAVRDLPDPSQKPGKK